MTARCCLALLLPLLAAAPALAQQGVRIGETSYGETVDAGVVGPYGPWHSGYHHVAWGQPVALVVPPTATHQTNWGWGVGNTRVTPINPQYAGPMNGGGMMYQYGRTRPTPYYVSDTLQFGVYYIRGPW